MFFELQAAQVEKWLLNPYMYLVVVGLILLSVIKKVEPLDRRFWVETWNDFLYGLLYAILYFPIIFICLDFSNNFLDTHLPWLRIEIINGAPAWLKFIIIVLFDDFLAYWSHRLRHRVKPLWYFHTVHHSQERLNPFTTKRFHPLENMFQKIVIRMVPMAIIGGSLELWYLYYLLDAVWDYFIHSNIRLNLGPLKYFIVTPQYHRVHHSRNTEQFDRNFSDRFVIWDQLFGTAYPDYETFPATGVENYPSGESLNFLQIHLRDLAYPFRMIFADIMKTRASSQASKANSR